MCAVVSTQRLKIEPREIALLCQKVENLVAGAPCGVMDQTASACGKANRLLALLCQPAELKESSCRSRKESCLWATIREFDMR